MSKKLCTLLVIICAAHAFAITAEAEFTGFVKPIDWALYDGTTSTAYSTVYRGNYLDGSEGSGSHPGVDIIRDRIGNHLTTTSPIVSIYEGVVTRKLLDAINHGNGWGNCIVLKHTGIPDVGASGIIFSSYAHLKSFAINPKTGNEWAVGETIPRGAVIGFADRTGTSSGIHLHFQIDRDYADYPLHPFWPNRTDGTQDAQSEVNVADADSLVLSHTLNPIAFVESHLAPRTAAITVDGDTSDWAGINPLITDNAGPNFRKLFVTNDSANVYFLVEYAVTTAPTAIFLDTDMNANSGCNTVSGYNLGIEFVQQGFVLTDFRACSFAGNVFPGAVVVALSGRFKELSIPIATLELLTPGMVGFDVAVSSGSGTTTTVARYTLVEP